MSNGNVVLLGTNGDLDSSPVYKIRYLHKKDF